MTTDVLERPDTAAANDEDRVFVTLTVADQLCGIPVLGVRDKPCVADSDDLARVFRFDLAQDSEMISPTIPI